jgi:hypothetical protein
MPSGTPLRGDDRERLNRLREAIAAGTYRVNPNDVAVKLILSMLEFGDDLATLELGDAPSTFELDGCLSKFESDDDLSKFEGTDSSEAEVEGPQGKKKKG